MGLEGSAAGREDRRPWEHPQSASGCGPIRPQGAPLPRSSHVGAREWQTPGIDVAIRRHAREIVAVHGNDRRDRTRGWCDRVLPGEGVAPLKRLVESLIDSGYSGFYDLEVFSDDGTFDNDYPDSLWRVPAEELARLGREAFTKPTTGGQV